MLFLLLVSVTVLHKKYFDCDCALDGDIFSVTRCSRSDSRYLLVTDLLIVSTDLTDVTLVSDDTY